MQLKIMEIIFKHEIMLVMQHAKHLSYSFY